MVFPSLTQNDELFIVDCGDGENRADLAWVDAMHAVFDEAHTLAQQGACALITTGSAKHYCNGLDVDYLAKSSAAEVASYVGRVEEVVSRILTFPAPTVAAVNGHAFGAGAFLVLAHDYVVMREDRGYVCWPEVHLRMHFTSGLLALLRDRLSPATAREVVVTGRRYTAPEAVAAGFVDEAVSIERLMDAAASYGRSYAATAGPNLARIKSQLHQYSLELLGKADQSISD